MLRLNFHREDGGSTFLRNVGELHGFPFQKIIFIVTAVISTNSTSITLFPGDRLWVGCIGMNNLRVGELHSSRRLFSDTLSAAEII
jgi:hypothetical protein